MHGLACVSHSFFYSVFTESINSFEVSQVLTQVCPQSIPVRRRGTTATSECDDTVGLNLNLLLLKTTIKMSSKFMSSTEFARDKSVTALRLSNAA